MESTKRLWRTRSAQNLHELLKSYMSLAEDANCVDEGLAVRAGMAIAALDDCFGACEAIAKSYVSNGNTKLQKQAHAAVHDAMRHAQ